MVERKLASVELGKDPYPGTAVCVWRLRYSLANLQVRRNIYMLCGIITKNYAE